MEAGSGASSKESSPVQSLVSATVGTSTATTCATQGKDKLVTQDTSVTREDGRGARTPAGLGAKSGSPAAAAAATAAKAAAESKAKLEEEDDCHLPDEIRAIITDYDGTVTGDLGVSTEQGGALRIFVPDSFRRIYQHLNEKMGIPVYIATGRSFSSFLNSRSDNDATYINPFPGVYSDGRVILDSQGNLLQSRSSFKAREVEEILKMVDLETKKKTQLFQRDPRRYKLWVSGVRGLYEVKPNHPTVIGDVLPGEVALNRGSIRPTHEVNSLAAIEDDYKDQLVNLIFCTTANFPQEVLIPVLRREAEERWLPRGVPLEFVPALDCALFLYKAGTNKMDGVRRLLEYIHVENDNVIVLGDGGNDETMLRSFQHSVAMGDGNPAAIKAAMHTTYPAAQHGWTRAVCKLLRLDPAEFVESERVDQRVPEEVAVAVAAVEKGEADAALHHHQKPSTPPSIQTVCDGSISSSRQEESTTSATASVTGARIDANGIILPIDPSGVVVARSGGIDDDDDDDHDGEDATRPPKRTAQPAGPAPTASTTLSS